MQNLQKTLWKGERLETDIYDVFTIEHLHRYAIAMEIIQNKNVLDIASGEGYGSNLMASVANSVVGVDISGDAVNHARNKYKKGNLKFLRGTAEAIPVESNTIDVVVSFETIEHHDKHKEMMLEISRVLTDDGILIISSPDKLNYSDIPNQKNHFHVKELYLEEFRSLIKEHFSNHVMLCQKVFYASLISPENDNVSTLKRYSGDCNEIDFGSGIINSVYSVCIASNRELFFAEASYFDGKKALDNLLHFTTKEAEARVKGTRSYKIGKFIASPYIFLRELLNPLRQG